MIERFPPRLRHFGDRFLALDHQRILVAARTDLTAPRVEALFEQFGMRLEPGAPRGNLRGVNHTPRRFWARSLTALGEPVLSLLVARPEVDWIGPVYRRPDLEDRLGLRAYLCPLPISLLVRFRRALTREQVARFAQANRLEWNEARSLAMGPFDYFEVQRPTSATPVDAFRIRADIEGAGDDRVASVHYESMPMMSPWTLVPNDPIYSNFGAAGRWNLEIIDAPAGWDLSTGANSVTVAVVDTGCDMSHPDLVFDGPGYNAGTGAANGTPTGPAGSPAHGTQCAGIAAARINNGVGIAGIAGSCRIHAVAVPNGSDAEVAAGINESANTAGARVISMSLGNATWDPNIIDPAIDNAHDNRDVVLCASSGNGDAGWVDYPAKHPKVIAVGASDEQDLRISVANWGSQYGPELDVVAPGQNCYTTDLQGAAGATMGDYDGTFNGTSCACPHASGVASVIRSVYPTLDADAVRRVLARSCEKISPATYLYAPTVGKPDGPWNLEVGYGRINLFRALDLADVYIRDNPADDGTVPSSGDFWNASDVVVRQADDGVFSHQPARRDQNNFIYVRVVNLGPAAARNVEVGVRVTPFAGTEFAFPLDWLLEDDTHVRPASLTTSFVTVAAGEEVVAKFRLSADQVEDLYGWTSTGWHPCVLASAVAQNDYFAITGVRTWTSNNAAQRNISIVEVAEGAVARFPFLTGHARNADLQLELVVDRTAIPRDVPVFLDPFDDAVYFPRVPPAAGGGHPAVVFPERTTVRVSFCGKPGTLTLGPGSSFDCEAPDVDVKEMHGAAWVEQAGRRLLRIHGNRAVIVFGKPPGQVRQMSLSFRMPGGMDPAQRLRLDVVQRDPASRPVGGCSAVFVLRQTG